MVEVDMPCLVSVITASRIVERLLQPASTMVQTDAAIMESENRARLPTGEHTQSTP
jgi:hypothetical protein